MKELGAMLVAAVLCVVCFAGRADAYGYELNCDNQYFAQILNECNPANHEKTIVPDDNVQPFDYGLYAHLIFAEFNDGNVEIGVWNTYEFQRREFTSLFGAKLYLNRILGW